MVALSNVSFGYRRGEPIVDGLTHVFAPALLTAVTGPSGCGKSTLLYLIGLLLTPWRGQIAIGDVPDAGHLGDGERSLLRAERIGFVFQDALLDPSRSVMDNVMEGMLYAGVPRSGARERAQQLLERFQVSLRADHRPGEVSGGQAQRVALCRALIKRPAVILADEPTGNLDATSSELVIDGLRRAASGGATVVIASHDARVVAACDRVLAL